MSIRGFLNKRISITIVLKSKINILLARARVFLCDRRLITFELHAQLIITIILLYFSAAFRRSIARHGHGGEGWTSGACPVRRRRGTGGTGPRRHRVAPGPDRRAVCVSAGAWARRSRRTCESRYRNMVLSSARDVLEKSQSIYCYAKIDRLS